MESVLPRLYCELRRVIHSARMNKPLNSYFNLFAIYNCLRHFCRHIF